jgi:prevent-host-death family protein
MNESIDSIGSGGLKTMHTLTANEAKINFGAFLDAAQREPVRVTRRDRVVGVLVSVQDYEAMRAFYANRLQHTLAEVGAQAQAAGLTPARLDELLADES